MAKTTRAYNYLCVDTARSDVVLLALQYKDHVVDDRVHPIRAEGSVHRTRPDSVRIVGRSAPRP